MKKIIAKLIEIADKLDEKNLCNEADIIARTANELCKTAAFDSNPFVDEDSIANGDYDNMLFGLDPMTEPDEEPVVIDEEFQEPPEVSEEMKQRILDHMIKNMGNQPDPYRLD